MGGPGMGQEFSRREAIGMLGAAGLAGASPALAQPPGQAPLGPEALAWLRRNARPLDGYDPSPDTLRPLVQALDGGQVIGLGEATLGSHEDQVCKAAIARALIAHGGVRVLAIEGNRRPAGRLDDYVRGGGPDPIATIRDGGFFQAWQSEPFIGLVGWIRGWNLAGRPAVRILGIDVSSVGEDALEAWRFFEVAAQRHVRTFEDPLAPLIRTAEARERTAFELARTLSQSQWDAARQALEQIRTIIAASNRPGAEEAARAALSARRAMDMARGARADESESGGNPAAALALRERMMADNLIDQAGRDRTVLWSHNLKASPGSGAIGAHLRRRLARNYRAVIFEAEGGSIRVKPGSSAALPADNVPWQLAERSPGPNGLGALLGSVGPDSFWLDLTGSADPAPQPFLAHPFASDWPATGAPSPSALPLANGPDLLVFLRRLTPSRLLPFVPVA